MNSKKKPNPLQDRKEKARSIMSRFNGGYGEFIGYCRLEGYDTFADAFQTRLGRIGAFDPDQASLGEGLHVQVKMDGDLPTFDDSDDSEAFLASTWSPTALLMFERETLLKVKRETPQQAYDAAAQMILTYRANQDRRYLLGDINKALVASAPMFAADIDAQRDWIEI